jgi:WD40 repeat protein
VIVLGLVIVDGLLWSSSIDGSIRLWDLAQNGDCQYVITSANGEVATQNAPQQNGAPPNGGPRSNAFTDLLTFKSPAAGTFVLGSSLNQTVKAWNGSNGECVANESHGDGVICLALSADLKGNPILLVGVEKGDIVVRNVLQTPNAPGFCLIFKLSHWYTAGHDGPVKAIRAGPANTFYTGGADGKLLIWQFTGDLGL